MVIAAQPLDEIVPLEPATMPGRVVIQWDKDDCADLGIIKIDLLGLGMLAVLEQAIPLIRQHEGVELDLAHLPPDDPAVYEMLSKADTVGVFQVESRAQMAILPRMKPRCFYDLVVEVALIRPGPIVGKLVHPYLARRAGRAPSPIRILCSTRSWKRTLGVPLFQEQLLRMAMTVGGFSAGEAEELRHAMGFKRSAARMEKIEVRLRAGMARHGLDGRRAEPDDLFAAAAQSARRLERRWFGACPPRAWVKTAGIVIVRQRPATAKGFLFITLEDETGMANLIVTPALFQQHRLLLRSARILLAEGVFQKVDGVMAVVRGALPNSPSLARCRPRTISIEPEQQSNPWRGRI
jgi:DNA polymerase III alpha subunit